MEAAEYMSASGEHGCPLAGIAQTRIVAPASGMPRELKTISSLREPCACAGETTPGHTCSASVMSAHKNPIAIFDRIIVSLVQDECTTARQSGKLARRATDLCPMNLFDFAVRRIAGRIDLHNKVLKKTAQSQQAGHRQVL